MCSVGLYLARATVVYAVRKAGGLSGAARIRVGGSGCRAAAPGNPRARRARARRPHHLATGLRALTCSSVLVPSSNVAGPVCQRNAASYSTQHPLPPPLPPVQRLCGEADGPQTARPAALSHHVNPYCGDPATMVSLPRPQNLGKAAAAAAAAGRDGLANTPRRPLDFLLVGYGKQLICADDHDCCATSARSPFLTRLTGGSPLQQQEPALLLQPEHQGVTVGASRGH